MDIRCALLCVSSTLCFWAYGRDISTISGHCCNRVTIYSIATYLCRHWITCSRLQVFVRLWRVFHRIFVRFRRTWDPNAFVKMSIYVLWSLSDLIDSEDRKHAKTIFLLSKYTKQEKKTVKNVEGCRDGAVPKITETIGLGMAVYRQVKS